MLISSLRDVIRTQATEMDTLQTQLKDLTADSSTQVRLVIPVSSLRRPPLTYPLSALMDSSRTSTDGSLISRLR